MQSGPMASSSSTAWSFSKKLHSGGALEGAGGGGGGPIGVTATVRCLDLRRFYKNCKNYIFVYSNLNYVLLLALNIFNLFLLEIMA